MTEQNQTIPSATQRTDISNITKLVRRGLLPQKDLSALRLALSNHKKVGDIAKLPRAQRDVLQRYNNAISAAALGTNQSVMAVSRNLAKEDFDITRDEYISEEINTDPPTMIILKRKGIRIFPDGKRVALYVNEKLGLTFTIPYSTSKGVENPMLGVTEETESEQIMENLEQVAKYASEENPKSTTRHFKFADGTKMPVAHGAAKAIHMVHGALNDENKKKFADMLMNPQGFEKAANFALSKVKFTINK